MKEDLKAFYFYVIVTSCEKKKKNVNRQVNRQTRCVGRHLSKKTDITCN